MQPNNHQNGYSNTYQTTETTRIRPLLNATLLDRDSALYIARKMFETYDVNGTGVIEESEARSMIIDAYTNVGLVYTPNRTDGEQYISTHDKDNDGKFTLRDMEKLCVEFLCGSEYASGINIIPENLQIRTTNNYTSSYLTTSQYVTTTTPIEREITYTTTFSYLEPIVRERDILRRNLTIELGADKVTTELNHAVGIFLTYDKDKNGYLERHEIPQILIDTYKNLGLSFNPSSADIDRYIEMMDSNGDGMISQQEYELFVLKALQNRNIILG